MLRAPRGDLSVTWSPSAAREEDKPFIMTTDLHPALPTRPPSAYSRTGERIAVVLMLDRKDLELTRALNRASLVWRRR